MLSRTKWVRAAMGCEQHEMHRRPIVMVLWTGSFATSPSSWFLSTLPVLGQGRVSFQVLHCVRPSADHCVQFRDTGPPPFTRSLMHLDVPLVLLCYPVLSQPQGAISTL